MAAAAAATLSAFPQSSLLNTGPRAQPFRTPSSVDLPGSLLHSHSFWDNQLTRTCKSNQYHAITCKVATIKDSTVTNDATLIREPHKYFDQVVITVRSGDGGHGAILIMPNQKTPLKSEGKHDDVKLRRKTSYKRDFDGSLILPMGGHGGDVVIFADESKDSLLEFHRKGRYHAKRGGNVDAMGVLTSQLHDGFAAPTLRIPVPVGL